MKNLQQLPKSGTNGITGEMDIETLLIDMVTESKIGGRIPTKIVLTEKAYDELSKKIINQMSVNRKPYFWTANLKDASKGSLIYDPDINHFPSYELKEFLGLPVENYGQNIKVEFRS